MIKKLIGCIVLLVRMFDDIIRCVPTDGNRILFFKCPQHAIQNAIQ